MAKKSKKQNIVKIYWNGDISLAKSFWLVSVVILGVVSIPSYFVTDAVIDNMGTALSLFLLFWTVFFYVFLVYVYVGLWRSSSKYITYNKKKKKSALWGYVVYTIIVLGVLRGVGELIIAISQ
tara:strand:- start:852 stop:1220 length:369 start_codon:yes stop_codon:yes gene_type:complete